MKKILFLSGLCLGSLCISAQEMTVSLDGLVGTMSNGIITLNIDKSGRANKMFHPDNGTTTNILGSSGIYFDYTADKNRALSPDKAEIVKLTDDYAEIVYSNTKDDLRFSQGYILRKGVSGVYTYVVVHGTPTSSNVNVKEVRVCTRLASTFLDGYVDDVMQGRIPSNAEMKVAEQKENTIQDATYRMADGSIYTKYNWAQFIAEDSVHGLMNGKVGVWNIPCSYEWLNGGPMRQELTVHATSKSPITIQMIQGEHLGGAAQAYSDGESQIFGPFFIYVNSADSKEEMIADAKQMAHTQMEEWPFRWFDNSLYPLDRATVSGRILLPEGTDGQDGIQVVLAEPGTELIRQGKKYIFWSKTDADGNFIIPNVRKGDYALYAYATSGTVTDELEVKDVAVNADDVMLETIEWTPGGFENLLWNIGENNRRSDGFNLSSVPRAYGLWEAVPASLTYNVDASDPTKDWYYAQCHNGTWNIEFANPGDCEGNLRLTASVAGSTNKPTVNINVNGKSVGSWRFPNNDASIYRSATQAGRHVVQSCTFPSSMLVPGSNTVSLTMSGISKNGGVMWDCIKLEAEKRNGDSAIDSVISDSDDAPYEIFTIGGVSVGTFDSLDDVELPRGVYVYRKGNTTGKIVR